MRSNWSHFYPRPPRGERQDYSGRGNGCRRFLSTPSARRATRAKRASRKRCGNFYPRPPRGERLQMDVTGPSMSRISIHALREESDISSPAALPQGRYFYPRPPRGERPLLNGRFHGGKKFLSTPSARRATPQRPDGRHLGHISIHALREESDGVAVRPPTATR